MHVFIRDLCLAYDEILSSGPPPLYSDFISYIRARPSQVGMKFWRDYLDGVVPTNFPISTPVGTVTEPAQIGCINRMIEGEQAASLHQLSEDHEITVADIFKTVWAIVLGSVLGTDSVCFGYLASGRDAPVPDVHNILGPLINMLVFRARLDKSTKLIDLIQEARNDHTQSLPHQHCSLKEIFHAVNGGQTPLFNTLVNVQRATTAFFVDEKDSTANRSITLRNIALHDPTEVCQTNSVSASCFCCIN